MHADKRDRWRSISSHRRPSRSVASRLRLALRGLLATNAILRVLPEVKDAKGERRRPSQRRTWRFRRPCRPRARGDAQLERCRLQQEDFSSEISCSKATSSESGLTNCLERACSNEMAPNEVALCGVASSAERVSDARGECNSDVCGAGNTPSHARMQHGRRIRIRTRPRIREDEVAYG